MESRLTESPLYSSLESMHMGITEVKAYLVSRQPQSDILNHHAEWADSILDLLTSAIVEGQTDPAVTIEEYAALVWLAYDLSDLREMLDLAMGELPF